MSDAWRKLEAEERRRRGTHRWDYVYPSNLWETWPWWFRWPVAVAVAVYFLVPFVHVTAMLVMGK